MEEYRKKLRSSKTPITDTSKEEKPIKKEDIYEESIFYPEDPESPRTPPTQNNLESYFPPSPFGRKRHQTYGDRFIPTRDRNLVGDFQMMEPSPSNSSRRTHEASASNTPSSNSESRRMSAFFRAELLDDPAALDEYVSPDSPARTPRRVLHYTNYPSSGNNSSNNSSANNSSINISNSSTLLASRSASNSSSGAETLYSRTATSSHRNNNNHSTSATNSASSISNLAAPLLSHASRHYSPDPFNSRELSSNPPIISPSPTSMQYNVERTSLFESPSSSRFSTSPIGEAGRRILLSSDKSIRKIGTSPIKTLDAPDLQDDFYLNLVDWGGNDCLAVGLGTCVYLWNANTSKVTKLCDFVTDTITSVNWSSVGSLLAVGSNSGRTVLYDAEHTKRLRTWDTHTSRVGSIAWRSNILTTGGRDHAIYHHDVRSSRPYFRKLEGHTQEVCGLKWNPEGTSLASGSNDNSLLIWNSHENSIAHRFSQHTAAVKAIAWSPHKRGVLVSGGGTADKTIKFWNTVTGNLTSSYDTGSQVCNIMWSKKTNDIVSTHGYSSSSVSSSNQVIVWKPDRMQRLATLTGHASRVLYMAMSNDGNTIVTGAGDETLRFWDIFSSAGESKAEPEDRKACLR